MNIYDIDYINTDGNHIHKTAIIGDNVKMGKGNIVMPYCVIGQPGFIRDTEKMEGQVVIGDNNRFGCHSVVMSGKKGETTIGDDNMLMNYTNVGHNVQIGRNNEIGVGTVIGGHCKIGDHNRIKLNCTIKNRLKIGSTNTIGMASNVVKDVGDSENIYGNPAVAHD